MAGGQDPRLRAADDADQEPGRAVVAVVAADDLDAALRGRAVVTRGAGVAALGGQLEARLDGGAVSGHEAFPRGSGVRRNPDGDGIGSGIDRRARHAEAGELPGSQVRVDPGLHGQQIGHRALDADESRVRAIGHGLGHRALGPDWIPGREEDRRAVSALVEVRAGVLGVGRPRPKRRPGVLLELGASPDLRGFGRIQRHAPLGLRVAGGPEGLGDERAIRTEAQLLAERHGGVDLARAAAFGPLPGAAAASGSDPAKMRTAQARIAIRAVARRTLNGSRPALLCCMPHGAPDRRVAKHYF